MKLILPLAFVGAICAAAPAFAQASLNTGSSSTQTATPANSSHAAGQSVGGLFTFPMARIAGGSGDLLQFVWQSTGGATVTYQVRLWDKNPASSTCTDNTAYVSNATDDKHLLVPPFTVTAAAPTNTTGDSKTYANYQFVPPLSWRNQDTTKTVNLYACVVTTATDTADDNNAVNTTLYSVQD